MAEAIARASLEKRGAGHVNVESAGVAAIPGDPASPGALWAAGQHGVSLGTHAARPVTEALLRDADWVLAMTPSHRARVLALDPTCPVELLGALDPQAAGAPPGIPDPFGLGADAYAETWDRLAPLVEAALDRLELQRPSATAGEESP
jgi:protein-tyrosine-phosphatase